jgi:hypothetical protein
VLTCPGSLVGTPLMIRCMDRHSTMITSASMRALA